MCTEYIWKETGYKETALDVLDVNGVYMREAVG